MDENNRHQDTSNNESALDMGTAIIMGVGFGFMFGLLLFPDMPIMGSLFGIVLSIFISAALNNSRKKKL